MATSETGALMKDGAFKVDSPFQPAGDQPKAIDGLVDGIHSGLAHQTLLGVTGSGKTFTIANVIQQVQRPTIIMAHNKTLAAQLGIKMIVFSGGLYKGLREVMAEADIILSSIPPTDEGDPVMRFIGDDFMALAPKVSWAGYLSATSVYGDRGGKWAFEDELLHPVTQRGWNRQRAEIAWLDSGAPVHVFRLAGIYGPEISGLSRHPFGRLRSGKGRSVIKPGHVVNRIYVTDIASAIMASTLRPNPVYIYNLADNEPSPPQDVIDYAAELIGAEPPPRYDWVTADISNMARSFYTANKRISNARAKQDLGWEPEFPNYRAGLRAIAGQEEKTS